MGAERQDQRQLEYKMQGVCKFKIGQLTRAVTDITGIHCTPAMVNNYEKKGLLRSGDRSPGGFRLYTAEDVRRVACIKVLQEEGQSLAEISATLEDCSDYSEIIEREITPPDSRKHMILQAAQEVFPLRGYEATTLADIAGRSGISPAAIYQYFESKEALFQALIDGFSFRDVLDDLILHMKQSPMKTEEDIRDALIRLSRAYIEMHDNNQEVFRMFLAQSAEFPEIGKKYNTQLVKPLSEATEELLRLAMESGLFRKGDTGLAAHAFYGLFLIFHVTEDLLEGEEILQFPKINRVEQLVDIYLKGMLAQR